MEDKRIIIVTKNSVYIATVDDQGDVWVLGRASWNSPFVDIAGLVTGLVVTPLAIGQRMVLDSGLSSSPIALILTVS